MISMKIFVNNNKREDGTEFTSYSCEIKKPEGEPKEYANIRFAKKSNIKPEHSGIIEIDNKKIFEVTEEGDKRRTFIVTEVKKFKPFNDIIEDDFFA